MRARKLAGGVKKFGRCGRSVAALAGPMKHFEAESGFVFLFFEPNTPEGREAQER
jgi:hypothetical protein